MIPTRKKKSAAAIAEFAQTHTQWLMTTRFSEDTWSENCAFRRRYPKIGCIYPTPEPIATMVPLDSVLFVLEMNNSQNRIMGIGMLSNHSICNSSKYRVYSEQNYNRYTYLGTRRIDREDMTAEEETVMKVFDILCFKGAKHMKRLRGIKAFPLDILSRCTKEMDLVHFVKQMFKERIVTASTQRQEPSKIHKE